MKKIISFILLIAFCFSSFSVLASYENSFPNYQPKVNIGRGNWSASTHGGVVCYDREGNPLLCFSTQGGFFFVMDLVTGEILEEYTMPGYTMSWFQQTGPDNCVYLHVNGLPRFYKYDPVAKTFEGIFPESIDPQKPDDSFVRYALGGGNLSDDGMLWVSDYETCGGSVYMYDCYTNKITKYGPLDPLAHYVQGVCADDKYIYAGMGIGVENSRVIRVDRKTREQEDFLRDLGVGNVYSCELINDKLLVGINKQLLIVNPETFEIEERIAHGDRGQQHEQSPYDPNIFYHQRGNGIYEYNIATKEHKRVSKITNMITLGWAELPNGDWVLTLRTNTMEKIGYYNPKTGETVVHDLSRIAETGPAVQSLEISPEGLMFCGGYQTSMGVYNVNTEEFVFSIPSWHQNEGVGFLNGKTYFGTYTDAVMHRYDPEKPLNVTSYKYDDVYQGPNANPSMVYDIDDGQDRPFVIVGHNDKVYIGTFSEPSKLGGTFTILEEEDGVNPPKAEVYRNVIPEQSVHGIAIKGNLAYLSSNIRNGLGAENPHTEAEMAVFDLDKKEVVERFKPELPGIGTGSQAIGSLAFGPDGLLWGVSNREGLVFAMDPETKEIVKSVSTVPGGNVNSARPCYLRWSDDGFLYTIAGWRVSVINPETMEYKRLVSPEVSLMTLDPYGNIWYVRGQTLECIKVYQYERLQRFLKSLEKLDNSNYTQEEWSNLQKAISEAKQFTEDTDEDIIKYAIRDIKGLRDKTPFIKPQNDIDIIFNGKKLEYDYDITGTVKIYNGTTYVPYRAYLEMLGYKVTWNVHSATINAVKEGNEISMIVGKNTYTFNGEKTTFDLCPIILSGRQYIPVRLISEKLGYEVKWNEKENTVEINK